jgi:hypothetical protein
MATFETKIVRARVTWSPFTAEEMAELGQGVLDHITARIQNVQNVDDGSAPALASKYATEKQTGRFVPLGGPRKYTGKPVRDWTLRGRTLQSLKVKTANDDVATIGPISPEAYKIIASRNKIDRMWGLSPSDMEALYTRLRTVLLQHVPLRFAEGAD